MKTYKFFTLPFILLFILALSACTSDPKLKKEDLSGFLSDYSELKVVNLESGRQAFRWLNPDLVNKKYKRLVLAPVSFYPEPHVQKNVERKFLHELLKQQNIRIFKIARNNGIPLTNKAGPNTLRLESAITTIKVSEQDFSAREVIPLRLIFSAVEMAAGGRDYDVMINFEFKLVDSMTNEVMMRGVRQGNTESLANSEEKLTIEHSQELLDEWGIDFNSGFLKFKEKFKTEIKE